VPEGTKSVRNLPLDLLLNRCYPICVIPSHSRVARSIAEIPVFRAVTLVKVASGGPWRFENLVGILAEVSEEVPSGAVSFVVEIIAEAQSRYQPVAWIAGTDSIFFPPDLSARGVDLSAVAVIRAGGETESLTAAQWLVGSGAMGLVIVDSEGHGKVSDASLGRILSLAERNQCAVIFLTRKGPHDLSLGSRVSLRGCVTRSGAAPFVIDIQTVKDKRSNFGSRLRRHYNGPSGMY
jgi:hypothetical protein